MICAIARTLAVLWIFFLCDPVGVEISSTIWDQRRYSDKHKEQKRHQMERLSWGECVFLSHRACCDGNLATLSSARVRPVLVF